MSINAISSVSLYEYYYNIENKEQDDKKSSALADEMKKYGLKPTEDEALNASMLAYAKNLENSRKSTIVTAETFSSRPWADLMYQLNIPFNDDPAQDIQDIKDEVAKLVKDFDDDELRQEVLDLENYAERLYLEYKQNSSNSLSSNDVLSAQLKNFSMLNMVNLL